VTSRFNDHVAFDCALSVGRKVKRDMIIEPTNRKPRRANRKPPGEPQSPRRDRNQSSFLTRSRYS
jgi:hypothetical protein